MLYRCGVMSAEKVTCALVNCRFARSDRQLRSRTPPEGLNSMLPETVAACAAPHAVATASAALRPAFFMALRERAIARSRWGTSIRVIVQSNRQDAASLRAPGRLLAPPDPPKRRFHERPGRFRSACPFAPKPRDR